VRRRCEDRCPQVGEVRKEGRKEGKKDGWNVGKARGFILVVRAWEPGQGSAEPDVSGRASERAVRRDGFCFVIWGS